MTRSTNRSMIRSATARGRTWLGLAILTVGVGLSTATPAQAWDPSTTHVGMVSRALTQSAVHLRWMEASDLSRGLFTALRIDPHRLDDDVARRIELAQRRAHADSGAQGLGGPGACPGTTAPPATRTRCVQGDAWEATALGWVALGLVAEVTPGERMLHHFSDPAAPSAATWSGATLPKRALRATQRRNGGPGLATLTGTAFKGTTQSAAGWLDDPDDPWAPPAMFEHLRQASMLADPVARQHHLALGLIGLGALLHVVQDSTVPAHARADLGAFLAPLSATPGDRGLPLAEYARLAHGRTALPDPVALAPRDAQGRRGLVLAPTLLAHLVGGAGATHEGVAVTAGTRFLSEGTTPPPQWLDPGMTAQAAAAALLADSGLMDAEREGASLSPWPAAEGYVLSGGGRPLAAFFTDAQQRIEVRLDRRVYRDQVGHLVPLAIDTSRSIVDLVFPAWPATEYQPGGDVLEFDATALPGVDPELSILIENAAGSRRLHRTVKVQAGTRQRLVGAIPKLAATERVVLVLRTSIGPHRLTAESLLASPKAAPDGTRSDALAPTVRSVTTPDADPDAASEPAAPPTDGTVQPPPGDTPPGDTPPGDTPPGDTPPAEAPPAEAPPANTPSSVPSSPSQTPGAPTGTAPDAASLRGTSPGTVTTPKRAP